MCRYVFSLVGENVVLYFVDILSWNYVKVKVFWVCVCVCEHTYVCSPVFFGMHAHMCVNMHLYADVCLCKSECVFQCICV